MSLQTIKTAAGETLVVLPLAEYEALCDAADAAQSARVMAAVRRGEEELLTAEEALAFVDAATPLAFWRRKRGLTQAALAGRAGISQSALAGMESGARIGTARVLKRVAEALGVRLDDLVIGD